MNGIPPDLLRRLVREALDAVLRERGLSVPEADGPLSSSGYLHSPPPQSGGGEESRQEGRVVVLLTGGGGDLATLRLSLQTLAHRFLIEVVVSADFVERRDAWDFQLPSARVRIHDRPSASAALSLLAECGALVAPLLSRSLAAKASLSVDDDMPSTLLCRALERGLPVVAVRSDTDLDTLRVPPALQQGPNSLRHLLETYHQRLTGWGVRWTTLDQLPGAAMQAAGGGAKKVGETGGGAAKSATNPTSYLSALPLGGAATGTKKPAPAVESAPSSRRRFVTREDLWVLLERGQTELRIGTRDIVTPEAEDFAASRGIRILRQEK